VKTPRTQLQHQRTKRAADFARGTIFFPSPELRHYIWLRLEFLVATITNHLSSYQLCVNFYQLTCHSDNIIPYQNCLRYYASLSDRFLDLGRNIIHILTDQQKRRQCRASSIGKPTTHHLATPCHPTDSTKNNRMINVLPNNSTLYLSRVISDDNVAAVLFEAVHLRYTEHVDDGNSERLHKRLGDISVMIQQALQPSSQTLPHTVQHIDNRRANFCWHTSNTSSLRNTAPIILSNSQFRYISFSKPMRVATTPLYHCKDASVNSHIQ